MRSVQAPKGHLGSGKALHLMVNDLTPHFEDVQAHYDLSDDFFRLFLDPTQTYSCAHFEREDMTLEEAQIAKIDLALGKLGLQPGMTLLDIGCGWGATMRRAIAQYDVNVVGLTLSKNQAAHVQKSFDEMDTPRDRRVLLAGWEQFNEPVDRIVSIGAFEHFGHDRHADFFARAHKILPPDGVLLLHTITGLPGSRWSTTACRSRCGWPAFSSSSRPKSSRGANLRRLKWLRTSRRRRVSR